MKCIFSLIISIIIILSFGFIAFLKGDELVEKEEIINSVEHTSLTNSIVNYKDNFNTIFSNNEALFTEVAQFMLKKEGFIITNNLDLSKVTVNNRPCLAEDIFSITEMELLKESFICMNVIPSFDSLTISKLNQRSSNGVNDDHIVFSVNYHSGSDYYDYGIMYCDDASAVLETSFTRIKDNWWSFCFGLI